MGPPSSGALTVSQILGILENFDLFGLGASNPFSWQLIGDASRLAFADRDRYVADEDFLPMPMKGLIDEKYVDERAELIKPGKKLNDAFPGTPKWHRVDFRKGDASTRLPSTSHFVIVDEDRNVVSMSSSIGDSFGSGLMTQGFLLNNQLKGFSFPSHIAGVPVANRIEAGKRPRSSMSPTIVLKNGTPIIALGSSSGIWSIPSVTQALVAMIDWRLGPQEAVDLPPVANTSGAFELEASTPAALKRGLEELGYETKIVEMNSGLQVIAITPESLTAGIDRRGEGVAVGD